MGKDGGKCGGNGESLEEHNRSCMDNLYKWQENGEQGRGGGSERKTGEKCDEIPLFPNPIFPIFPEAADLPISRKYPWVSENSGTSEA